MTFRFVLFYLCFALAFPKAKARTRAEDREIHITEKNANRFSELVAKAEQGTTFVLSGTVEITSVVTINTDRVTLRGASSKNPAVVKCREGSTAGFVVKSDDVRFLNLVIRDCQKASAAVNVGVFNPFEQQDLKKIEELKGTFKHVRFLNNGDATNPGGAGALFIGNRYKAHIVSCKFIGNSAQTGGAIYARDASLVIRSSVFQNNTAVNIGGAIYAKSKLTETKPEFESNIVEITDCKFIHNKQLVGHKDLGGLNLANGVDLEIHRYLVFPFPSPSGGAIHVANLHEVTITNSLFDGNSAVLSGGAIFLFSNQYANIYSCTFQNNVARRIESTTVDANELLLGGAIFAATADRTNSLAIKATKFENNSAGYGGALHAVAPSAGSLSIETSTFSHNEATFAGGAILLRSIASPAIRASRFIGNSAFRGGAILVTNGGGLRLSYHSTRRQSVFRNNLAFSGGAIFTLGAASVELSNALFDQNHAEQFGGAVFVSDVYAQGTLKIQSIRMRRNKAEKGGAIYMENLYSFHALVGPEDTAAKFLNITVSNDNDFRANEAVAGGAIYYRASNLVLSRFTAYRCNFFANKAHGSLASLYDSPLDYPQADKNLNRTPLRGLLQTQTYEKEDLNENDLVDPLSTDPCYPGGGGAVCLDLNVPIGKAAVDVKFRRSKFENNYASVGGGLLVVSDASSEWKPGCAVTYAERAALQNTDPCKSLTLRLVSFTSNFAHSAGGGIFASNFSHIQYSAAADDLLDEKYEPLLKQNEEEIFTNNSVGAHGYGPIFASNARTLKISEPQPEPQTNIIIRNQSSGSPNHLQEIRIQVLDELNQVISGGVIDSKLRISVKAYQSDLNRFIASGQIESVANAGVASFKHVVLSATAGQYAIGFQSSRKDVKTAYGVVEIRSCGLGEINNTASFLCEACPQESFAYESEKGVCNVCPSNARCRGGFYVVPLPKYWHSTPFSTIMHECFHRKACSYSDRTKTLERSLSKSRLEFFDRVEQNSKAQFLNSEYTQCAAGYEGPLCGSCSDGYGLVDGRICRKCMSKFGTGAIAVLLILWQLFLVSITSKSALVAIRDLQSAVNLEQSGQPLTKEKEDGGRLAQSALKGRQGQNNVHDSTSAAQHVSEIIKIFVNFVQVTSVAVHIDANWTTSVSNYLGVLNFIAGFSHEAIFLPISCLLDGSLTARSIYGMLLRVALPLCLMLLAMAFFLTQWIHTRRNHCLQGNESFVYFKSRLVMCCLVVVFFAYQPVSRNFMSTLTCVKLDSEKITNEALYPHYSVARDRYWTEDTNIQCFEGKHVYLAGLLGIPGLILFTFGVPSFVYILLVLNRAKDKLGNIDVLSTYGFIYQNYEDKYVYWEVFILLRKALIGAIIVFAYPLGANLQGVIALGVLIIALAFHLVAVPFKHALPDLLEGSSLLASIFTFYAGIVFNDENTSDAVNVLLSTLLVFFNTVLIIMFMLCGLHYANKHVLAKLKLHGVEDIPINFFARVLKLMSVISEKVTTSLSATLHGRRRNRAHNKQNKRAGEPKHRSGHRTVSSMTSDVHLMANNGGLSSQNTAGLQSMSENPEIQIEVGMNGYKDN